MQTYAPNKTKRFKSGLVFCKSFANFELDNLKYKKKS